MPPRRDVLLLEDGCSYCDDVARRLLAAGQPDPGTPTFGSVEADKRCTDAGLDWTVLPGVTAVVELRAGALTVLPGPPPPQPVDHLITHPDRILSTVAPSSSTTSGHFCSQCRSETREKADAVEGAEGAL